MKALVKKDFLWMAVATATGLVVHLLPVLAYGARELWVIPDDQAPAALTAVLGAWALLFGLVAGVHEDLRRTREYLLFRGVSWRRIFLARQAQALAVIAFALFLPLLSHYGGTLLWSRKAPLVDPSRLGLLIGIETSAFALYALGAFSGVLARRVLGIAFVALPAAAGWVTLLVLPMIPGLFRWRAAVSAFSPAFVLVMAFATATLLAAAYFAEGARHDADQPLPSRVLLAAVPTALVGSVAFFTLVNQGALWAGYEALLSRYPEIAFKTDGTAVLVASPVFDRTPDGHLREVDDGHHPGDSLVDKVRIRFDPDSVKRAHPPTWDWMLRGRPAIRIGCGLLSGPVQNECFMMPDGHVLRVQFPSALQGTRPARLQLGKEPGGQPFSNEAFPIGETYRDRRALLFYDPGDGQVWVHDLAEGPPLFRAVGLPGSDRVEEAVSLHGSRYDDDEPEPLIVRGARGHYRWTGVAFEPIPLPVLGSRPDAQKSPAKQELWDPLDFRITIEAPQGPLSHEYRPRLPREQLWAAALYGVSALRPPVLELGAVAVAPSDLFRFDQVWNPLVAGGRRPWLWGATVALAVLLAVLAVHRLGRFHAATSHRLFWGVAIFLLGLPAFVSYLALVRRRAYLPEAAMAEAPAPKLLLESA